MCSPRSSAVPSTLALDHDPPSASPAKPLPARVLKKREADRRCQRIIRERTKSKIAALEERVRNFEDHDATGQIKLLTKQLSDAEKERDSLAKKFETIEKILREGKTDNHDAAGGTKIQSIADLADVRTDWQSSAQQDADQVNLSSTVQEHKTSEGGIDWINAAQHHPVPAGQGLPLQRNEPVLVHGRGLDVSATGGQSDETLHRSMQDSIDKSVSLGADYAFTPPHAHYCECHTVQRIPAKQRPFNLWSFANEVLTSHFTWPAYYKLVEDPFRDDTPVRAVVEGWDAVESRGSVHPSWQLLKKLDMFVSKLTGPRERLAILYTIHLLLESHFTPGSPQTLPEYYLRRPSEELSHSYATEFFMWPGVRERFVFAEHTYCTNSFWFLFLRNMRILWPYEFRDCYVYNVEASSYALSPLFVDHLNDIKVWAMRIEFFERWPELQADIPVFNSIPGSVSTANQRHYLVNSAMRRRAVRGVKPQIVEPSVKYSSNGFSATSTRPEERVPHSSYQQPKLVTVGSQTPTGTAWVSEPALLPHSNPGPAYHHFYSG